MMNKKWSIEFKPKAVKELKKLDKKPQAKIINYLEFIIENFEDPRMVGKALVGKATNILALQVR